MSSSIIEILLSDEEDSVDDAKSEKLSFYSVYGDDGGGKRSHLLDTEEDDDDDDNNGYESIGGGGGVSTHFSRVFRDVKVDTIAIQRSTPTISVGAVQ